ncbi:MAG: YihY/virulence factor BrkB family protein [Chloroflexi bacterium]|nr:YihY/virulence factor BrkB family protein [Chloroflexota bacterium]
MLSFRFLKDWLLTAVQKFGEHNCGQLAASISYYVLFSIFPLLIFLVAVVGIFLNESAQADVVDEVMSVFPLSEDGGREDVTGAVDAVSGSGGQALGLIGLLGMVWAASAMFSAIRRSLNIIYHEQEFTRPFVQSKLIDLSLVLGVGLFFASSVFVTAALRVIRARSEDLAAIGDLSEELGSVWTLGVLAIPFLFSFAAFTFLYAVVPAKNGTLQSAIPGAIIAALAFELVKNLFGFYVANFASFDVVFGSLGAVAAFLFWVFISAQIMLFGAEVARAYQTVERSTVKQGKLKGMGLPLHITIWRIVRGLFVRGPKAENR